MSAAHHHDAVPMTMTAVAILVAQAHGMSLDDIRSRRCSRDALAVRDEAMARMRSPGIAGRPDRTYPREAIAEFFGVSVVTVDAAMERHEGREKPAVQRLALARPPADPGRPKPTREQQAAVLMALDGICTSSGFMAAYVIANACLKEIGECHRRELTAQGWVL